MNLLQRFGFFGFGLFLGIIILLFFLSGKKTSCAYGPNSRVLKNIQEKKQLISSEATIQLKKLQLDTSAIRLALAQGKVDFGKSNTKLDSCKIYIVYGEEKLASTKFTFENCSKKATLLNVEISE